MGYWFNENRGCIEIMSLDKFLRYMEECLMKTEVVLKSGYRYKNYVYLCV